MCKDETEDVACSFFRVKHMRISEKMCRGLTRQLLLMFRTSCQLLTCGLFGILSIFDIFLIFLYKGLQRRGDIIT